MTVYSFMESVGNQIRNSLVRAVPVDTGELKNSITYSVNGDIIEFNMAEHGLFVEFGTKPHIILPKEKKALKWKSGGSTVFATRVQHPGTKPQPFIRNTFYHKLPKIIAESAALHLGEEFDVEVTYNDFNN